MTRALRRAMPLALFVAVSLAPGASIALALKGATVGGGTAASFSSVDAVSLIQQQFPEFGKLQKLGVALKRGLAKLRGPPSDEEDDPLAAGPSRDAEVSPASQTSAGASRASTSSSTSHSTSNSAPMTAKGSMDPELKEFMAKVTQRLDADQRFIEIHQANMDKLLSSQQGAMARISRLEQLVGKTASDIHARQEGVPPAYSPQEAPEDGALPVNGRGSDDHPPWYHHSTPGQPPSEVIPPMPYNPDKYSDLELDGGGKPWKLFNDNAPMVTAEEAASPEVFVPAHPSTDARCPHDGEEGYRYYNVSIPHLVPFILPKGDRRKNDAALIVLPGGAGYHLSWHKEGTHVAKWLNSMGYSAFVLKYRVPSKKPMMGHRDWSKPTIDGQRALRLVRSRASQYELNRDRIGAIGFGAGGVIAAHLSQSPPKYGATDVVDEERFKPDYQLMIYAADAPYPGTTAKIGPTFMAIARDDPCSKPESALKYFDMLEMRGRAPNEMHIFAEGGHGFGDCSLYTEGMTKKEACAWMHNAAAYLRGVVLHEYDTMVPP